MDEIRRNELKELKKFFVDEKWVDGLFQILFLLEDIKPGMDLQQERRRKLKHLRNMLYWFDLYVSIKHGGYATKNKKLYKQWNKFFGFKKDAEKFLGYPTCCVRAENLLNGHAKYSVYLYSIVKEIRAGKRTIKDLQQFIDFIMFLHHYPCRIDCNISNDLVRKYLQVIKKYYWLVEDILPDERKHKIKILKVALQALSNPPDELRNTTITSQFGFYPIDIAEILENGRAFTENVEYGEYLLDSLL